MSCETLCSWVLTLASLPSSSRLRPARTFPCSFLAALASILFAPGSASVASAKPPHKSALVRYYGERLSEGLKSCHACHLTDDEIIAMGDKLDSSEENPWNSFGRSLLERRGDKPAESIPLIERLRSIADKDSDGDGVANELELLSGHAPGNAQDKPTDDELAQAVKSRGEFLKQAGLTSWDPLKPISRPPVPAVRAEWVRNPIDAFLAQRHEERGLKPRPEAPRHILLRRVTLDLTGLPPTRDELQAFLADRSPDAYERAVDRLLASPRYGERWGRHWMDIWRYSDWTGWGEMQVRDSHRHVWRWRDWIVESLNADKGYDRMILEMLAGDELAPEDPNIVRATGYLVRNHKMLSREKWLQDTVDHTAQAFLGVTMACARCHDHMYDLISQQEYYQLRAVFEPHQVRLDRVPGQPDTVKDGLARVYDADLAVKTFLYTRGDESTPQKDRPLSPGVPAAIGGTLKIEPIQLPLSAFAPDKRAFVREETRAAAERAIEEARGKLISAQTNVQNGETGLAGAAALSQKLAAAPDGAKPDAAKVDGAAKSLDAARENLLAQQDALRLAELDVPLAAARHEALAATIQVEQLEEQGAGETSPEVLAAARRAAAAQRQAGLLEAKRNLLAADQATNRAARAAERTAAASTNDPQNAALAEAAKKSAAELAPLQKKATESRDAYAAAEKLSQALDTGAYTKRAVTTYPAVSSGRRLALARWIADKANPLTPRVAVNHLWARHFDVGLVPTVSNLGQNGDPPTHPALIDWLAAELMEPTVADRDPASKAEPWSMKHLHRLIVTSAAYRMDSTPDAEGTALDPENRLYWRMPTRRMQAEVVRDSLLYVAGSLDLTMGGPDIDHRQGLTVRRRSLYFRHAAEKQMEFLKLFDAAAPSECYARKESIVPQQALALANSELTVIQARLLARKLAEGASSDPDTFIEAAFEQVLARPATAAEKAACREFLDEQARFFQTEKARLTVVAADKSDGAKPSADTLLRAEENLVHVLLNHHDFVTIR